MLASVCIASIQKAVKKALTRLIDAAKIRVQYCPREQRGAPARPCLAEPDGAAASRRLQRKRARAARVRLQMAWLAVRVDDSRP